MELLRELSDIQHQHGWVSNERLHELSLAKGVPLYRLEGLVSFYPHFRREKPRTTTVRLCRDVCCQMAGASQVAQDLRSQHCDQDVEFTEVSCLGRCDEAPAVAINDVPASGSVDELSAWIAGSATLPTNDPTETRRRWKCDPYADGAQPYSLTKSLLSAEDDPGNICVDRLVAAGLRGMGGAGFPTGRKWELVRAQSAIPKYVICNADESEPGTFKDRVILEELPHLVLEGMLLAGLTIGAETGIIYLRHEYAREQKALERELERARQLGILGENAAGSGRRFDVEIFVSPGGYILGEETALLEALEDKRGEPRNRPPYPGQHGLWGQPTLVNNVESFALATSIIHHGADWWHDQGVGDCSGLKVVCVSGDVSRPGVHEVPVGTTVREVIELSGGMKDGKPLLAFLPGGASSNFLPATRADTPLDFDAMQQAGSMLGTGAVIVMAQGRDLYALATNLVTFFRNESCGKCVPCRIGSEKAVALLENVATGDQPRETLDILPELGETLEQTSICGLGQVALNPILSMLTHFPDAIPTHP